MFDLLTGILSEPDFKDYSNLSRLLKYESSEVASRMATEPLAYAMAHAQASQRPAQQFLNLLSIVSSIYQKDRQICTTATQMQKSLDLKPILLAVDKSITNLFHNMMKKEHISFGIHSAEANREEIKARLAVLVDALKGSYPRFEDDHPTMVYREFEPEYSKDFFVIPGPKNYVTETFFGPAFLSPESAHFELIASLLAGEDLKKVIQEKSGALGSGVRFNPLSSTITVYSDKDPNTLKTYENFERIYQKLANGDFT